MEFSFLTLNKMVLGCIIILSTFIAFVLLRTSNKRSVPNTLLGVHFLIVGFQMTGHFFSYFLFDVARYSQYNSALVLSLPPLLYLYVKVLLSEKKWKFSSSHFIHFSPSLTGVIIGLNGLVLPSEHRLLLYISGFSYGLVIISQIQTKSKFWSLSVYKMQEVLSWVKTLTYLFGLILLMDAIFFLGFRLFGNYLMLFETLVLFSVLGYTFFAVSRLLKPKARRSIFGFPVFRNHFISPKKVEVSLTSNSRMVLKLQRHMETHVPYMNPELTLSDVSKALNLKKRELSELINGVLGTNFVSYVNSYRISMAKQLLINPEETNLTISEIMYEVGFNSRSSFNTLFKKETGMTPSEFREGHIYQSTTPKPIIQQLQ